MSPSPIKIIMFRQIIKIHSFEIPHFKIFAHFSKYVPSIAVYKKSMLLFKFFLRIMCFTKLLFLFLIYAMLCLCVCISIFDYFMILVSPFNK